MAALFNASPKRIKRLLQQAEKARLTKQLKSYHKAAFAAVDCLACGRCCKGYSPRFKTPDITRIAKSLGIRQGVFIESYLRLDEDNDYVTKTQPCPFLELDNTCRIYDDRPSDCARFPYTDEDIFWKKPALTAKNAEFCPAVQHVITLLEAALG
jgi:uncharacterized protein